MSWRDETSSAVQDDLDGLVAVGIETAQALLAEHREFLPFGVRRDDDGFGLVAGFDVEVGERPEAESVIEVLREGLRGDRDTIRAAAVVAMVLTDGDDAIRVQAEHRDGGPAITVLLRYRVTKWRQQVSYGAVSASEATRQIWTD